MLDSQQLVAAIWSISEGRGSDDELALLRADQRASLIVLDRLIDRDRGRSRCRAHLVGRRTRPGGCRFHRHARRPSRNRRPVASSAAPDGKSAGRRRHAGHRGVLRDTRRTPRTRRGAAASVVVRGPGGGLGRRPRCPSGGQRRSGHSSGGDRWPIGGLAAAPGCAAAGRHTSRSCRHSHEGRTGLAGGNRRRARSGRCRRQRHVARTRRARRSTPRGAWLDRAEGTTLGPSRRGTRRSLGSLGSGADGSGRDQRSGSDDARCGRRRRRRRRPGDDHRDHHRRRPSHRHREHRAHGTACRPGDGDDGDRPRRHGDRPHGRSSVPRQRRLGDHGLEADRSMGPHGDRPGPPEADGSAGSAASRWRLDPLRVGAVG